MLQTKHSLAGLTDRDAEDVGLQLHQQPVGGHAPVHLQLAKWDATVLVHGIQDLKENNKNKNSVPTRAKQLVEFCL